MNNLDKVDFDDIVKAHKRAQESWGKNYSFEIKQSTLEYEAKWALDSAEKRRKRTTLDISKTRKAIAILQQKLVELEDRLPEDIELVSKRERYLRVTNCIMESDILHQPTLSDSYLCDCGKNPNNVCKYPDKYRDGGCD